MISGKRFEGNSSQFDGDGNQEGSGVKLNDTLRFAIPENHT